MGVYNPLAKMPSSCDACENWHKWTCDLWHEKYMEERHPDCPLVEVKAPHGRLGDLDALAMKWIFGRPEKIEIQESPTIIEAEGNDED